MSSMVKPRHLENISNKDTLGPLSYREEENYDFKYIPETHFKYIVKNVQRQRCKEDEERVWASFVKEQEFHAERCTEQEAHPSMRNIKDLLRESIQDVDRELKRLEEDALPERNSSIHHSKGLTVNKTMNLQVTNGRSSCTKKLPVSRAHVHEPRGNTLVPITEEDNVVCHEKLWKTKNARKSSSDPLIVRNKYYSDQLVRATDHPGEDSSAETSTGRDNNKDYATYLRPDPAVTHKILAMQNRIGELLDDITSAMSRVPLPDGDNDLKRRQQRAMEFSTRLSRYYLYDLNRFVGSIRRHVMAVSPRLKQSRRSIAFHQEIIEQKLLAAHQLLLQALAAYCKHIPSSVIKDHPAKLKEVLQVALDLKDICDKILISANYCGSGDADLLPLGKKIQEKCDTILAKLNLGSEAESQQRCHNADSTMSFTACVARKKSSNRKNLSRRLSMYNVDTKACKNGQRKKAGCPRAKERMFWAGNLLASELPHPSPVTQVASSKENIPIDTSKHSNYSKEDDIKTMINELPLDSENESSLDVQRPRIPKKSCAEVASGKAIARKKKNAKNPKVTPTANDSDAIKKVTTFTKEHLSTLVPVIADLMCLASKKENELEAQPVSEASMETLLEFMQKYQSPKDSDTKRINCCTCSSSTDGSCKCVSFQSNRDLYDSRKHVKNMQLICLPSRDSELPERFGEESTKRSRGRSIKSEIVLTIRKETEARFFEYRREYQKVCRAKPMYSSNTQNKPWDVVAWISDKLVEELIVEIAKELQMNDVIQKLFELEFQEF